MQPILQSWLSRHCESADRVSSGTLWVRKGPDHLPILVAIHPPDLAAAPAPGETHRAAAEAVMAASRAAIHAGDESDLVAAPGFCAGLRAVAVIEGPKTSPHQQAAALDGLCRGLGWLEWTVRLQRSKAKATKSAAARAPSGPGSERTLELLAIALEPRPVSATALALTTELASLLGCERVSLGRYDGDELELDAISHTAGLDRRSALARDLAAAMQEAIDQDAVVVHPVAPGEAPLAAAAHRHLADEHGLSAVWSLPLRDDDELVGALTVEFGAGQAPDPAARAWLEQLASLLGPVVELRRRDQAGPRERIRSLLGDELPRALGFDRLQVRVALGLAALAVLALALLPATHHVAAPAQLEGIVQRAIVAPMPAYVAESRRRAGDAVAKGEVLGVLEDADLRLEARKWAAKREQRRKELRAATANHDRSQVRILQAQLEQAEAEVDLISEQLQRTRLVAPFDGVITHGDLSQSLGSPVERGQVLFEVAPRDDHRVILEVDGRDIAFVREGQSGRLTLQALPGDPLPFTVRRVTPISSSEAGRSFFRVEAALHGQGEGLRPGMDGVAKIDIGNRSVLWIWTHSAVDWLRMTWWTWVP